MTKNELSTAVFAGGCFWGVEDRFRKTPGVLDAISGYMWLDGISGADKLFYTTGRLTSEIVMKSALMGIPVLLSRSGVTQMGLELARNIGVTLIARAKGQHFLVYNGADRIEFDAVPKSTHTGRHIGKVEHART